MMKIIKDLLLKVIDNIDAGNSNLTEEEAFGVIEQLKRFTDKDVYFSKYQACQYLNVSRATFDAYIRTGKLSKGEKVVGFKELRWNKKHLDSFIEEYKNK